MLEKCRLQIKLFESQNLPYYYFFNEYDDKKNIIDLYDYADTRSDELFNIRKTDAIEIILEEIPEELQKNKLFFLHICLKVIEKKYMKITIIENGHSLNYRNYYSRGKYFKENLGGGITAILKHDEINRGLQNGYIYHYFNKMPFSTIPFPVFFVSSIETPYRSKDNWKRAGNRNVIGWCTCTDVQYFYGDNVTKRDEKKIAAWLKWTPTKVAHLKKKKTIFIIKLENFVLLDCPTTLMYRGQAKAWEYLTPDLYKESVKVNRDIKSVGHAKARLNNKLEEQYPKYFGF